MKSSRHLDIGAELLPVLGQWVRPDRSAAAEEVSLKAQARQATVGEEPSTAERERVVRELASALPQVPFDMERIRAKAVVAVRSLKPTASPGYPYMRHAASNEEYRNLVGDDHIVELALERIRRLVSVPMDQLRTWTAVQHVSEFLRDPCRVFGKNEVHHRDKVAQGRLRLIYSVSIIDQVVERVFNSSLNQAEISRWEDLPACPGMGLHDDGLAVLQAKMRAMANQCGTDVSGWDFCVKQWMLDDEASVRSLQSGFGYDSASPWHRIAIVAGCTCMVLSNGKFWEQSVDYRGLMDSGRYVTSSGNSKMRCLVKGHAFPETPLGVIAMGDDCVESLPDGVTEEEVVRRYARLGVRIKEVELFRVHGHVEFCSYRFDLEGSVEPVRWHKMLATFLATWPPVELYGERYMALMRELRHSPRRDDARRLLRQVAVSAAPGRAQ